MSMSPELAAIFERRRKRQTKQKELESFLDDINDTNITRKDSIASSDSVEDDKIIIRRNLKFESTTTELTQTPTQSYSQVESIVPPSDDKFDTTFPKFDTIFEQSPQDMFNDDTWNLDFNTENDFTPSLFNDFDTNLFPKEPMNESSSEDDDSYTSMQEYIDTEEPSTNTPKLKSININVKHYTINPITNNPIIIHHDKLQEIDIVTMQVLESTTIQSIEFDSKLKTTLKTPFIMNTMVINSLTCGKNKTKVSVIVGITVSLHYIHNLSINNEESVSLLVVYNWYCNSISSTSIHSILVAPSHSNIYASNGYIFLVGSMQNTPCIYYSNASTWLHYIPKQPIVDMGVTDKLLAILYSDCVILYNYTDGITVHSSYKLYASQYHTIDISSNQDDSIDCTSSISFLAYHSLLSVVHSNQIYIYKVDKKNDILPLTSSKLTYANHVDHILFEFDNTVYLALYTKCNQTAQLSIFQLEDKLLPFAFVSECVTDISSMTYSNKSIVLSSNDTITIYSFDFISFTSTNPLGLSSTGEALQDKCIYSIHATCNKLHKRYLLLATFPNDCITKDDVYGGAYSTVVLDISYYLLQLNRQDLIPIKIIAHDPFVVIVFTYNNSLPIAYAIYQNNSISKLYKGSDVIFLNDIAIVLDDNSIHKIKYQENHWIQSKSTILKDMILKRIFAISTTKYAIVYFGTHLHKNCIALGPFSKNKLPPLSYIYLEDDESAIICFVQLQDYFVMSTTKRILILSHSPFSIVSSVTVNAHSLTALGSKTVAFITNNKLCYTSCLPHPHNGINILSTIQEKLDPALVAIRPDRYIVTNKKRNHITKPLLVLEPLVFNLLAEYKDDPNDEFYNKLKYLVQKFGTKSSSFPYAENEGIGTRGMGITTKLIQLLQYYNIDTKLVGCCPSWLPMSIQMNHHRRNNEASLQIAINTSMELLQQNKDIKTILQSLDSCGTKYTDTLLFDLMLSNIKNKETLKKFLENLTRNEGNTTDVQDDDEVIVYALLVLDLLKKDKTLFHVSNQWEQNRFTIRNHSILNKASVPEEPVIHEDTMKETHVWEKGPSKMEELLLLDRIEEWLGRCKPALLGKEGVAAATETGERALLDILNANDDDSVVDNEGCWIDLRNVGRIEMDYLSAYYRFSEGEWKDGFGDLSKYQNKAMIVGDVVLVEPTTSSVDEGEDGKIRPLYDVIFSTNARLALEVKRGNSLDVGVFHILESRQACSIEFWYHLPHCNETEISLVSRTFEEDALWELMVMPSGELELRSNGGSILSTKDVEQNDDDLVESEEVILGAPTVQKETKVSWTREDGTGGWNHVCLTFSCKNKPFHQTKVQILMKGVLITSSTINLQIPKDTDEELNNWNTKLLLGAPNIRLTELRIWNCVRAESDVKANMYEYLSPAEMKKKLKVRIRKATGSKIVAPPKPLKRDEKVSTKNNDLSLFEELVSQPDELFHQLPMEQLTNDLKNEDEATLNSATTNVIANKSKESTLDYTSLEENNVECEEQGSTSDESRIVENDQDAETNESLSNEAISLNEVVSNEETSDNSSTENTALPKLKYSLSKPLSNVIRSSVTAALLRGPPAARHFGGTRSGILDKRCYFDLGSIAICGTKKTVVYSHGKTPPVKTYPVVASGAIVTDVLDEYGTQYMCCFMAKEKRLAVFDLRTKVIVVELQMTTKLNFWRFIPCFDKVVFLLITPVGAFHWLPLDHSPRPRQIWKRGEELQGKKIISYEEGELNLPSNKSHCYSKSRISLILASSISSGSSIEAWCVTLHDTIFHLINPDMLGAALFWPMEEKRVSPFPYICIVQTIHSEHVVQVLDICDSSTCKLSQSKVLAEITLNNDMFQDTLVEPTMAMGSTPYVLILCLDDIIVLVYRKYGMVLAFMYNEKLVLFGQENVGQYIVDASICHKNEKDIEVILLLSDRNDSRDANIGNLFFER